MAAAAAAAAVGASPLASSPLSPSTPEPSPELVALCRALPKAELHAHLHGSIRPATLAELVAASEGLATSAEAAAVIRDVLPAPHRSLRDCFRIFDVIHGAVTDVASVARITREMVEDCAADGVTYVEIRSTPRRLRSAGGGSALSADVPPAAAAAALQAVAGGDALDADVVQYAAAVVRALAEVEARGAVRCVARLLLSINRTGSVEAAAATIAVAAALSRVAVARRTDGGDGYAWVPPGTPHAVGPYVVGLDVSGDPTRGSLAPLLPLLATARARHGLRCTVHAGEVMNVAETAAVLEFGPDRLGHMCVLAPATAAAMAARGAATPPIEICPTSNALTLHLPSLDYHPTIASWVDAGVRFALCTDDSGVFGVTLSAEYAAVATALRWDTARLAALAAASFDMAFAPPALLAAARAGATSAP